MALPESFSIQSLTTSINKLPRIPTKIRSLGIFIAKPIRDTTIKIDQLDGRLVLVSDAPRGASGASVKSGKRSQRKFTATHLPQYRKVLAEDSQGVRKFGSENEAEAVADVVNSKLQEMQNNIVVTREWQHMGAIKGQILDADGTTVLADMYAEFEVAQTTVNMALSTAATEVRTKLMEAKRASEKSLGGLLANGSRALCSPGFMDQFTNHANVKAAFANWQARAETNAIDVRGGFVFGSTEFIEYDASVGGKDFIADGEAYLFPNAPGLFIETLSPADYMETVNTLGLEFYAKAKEIDWNKGVDLEAQSNPFSLCTIPDACVKLLAA